MGGRGRWGDQQEARTRGWNQPGVRLTGLQECRVLEIKGGRGKVLAGGILESLLKVWHPYGEAARRPRS